MVVGPLTRPLTTTAPATLTADQYRRRIERLCRVVTWGRDNPYAEIIRERVESGRAEFATEVAEAKQEPSCAF